MIICVYVCVFCVLRVYFFHTACRIIVNGVVDLVGLKHNSYEPIFLQCFETVGWVLPPVKTCPQYDV